MSYTVEVILDFDIEGYHCYPSAPRAVDFLSHKHRHLFRIKCGLGVTHNDRDKEIFIEQDKIKTFLNDKYGRPCNFNTKSCEMIAEEILEKFNCKWVEVLEDGRGGAKVCK